MVDRAGERRSARHPHDGQTGLPVLQRAEGLERVHPAPEREIRFRPLSSRGGTDNLSSMKLRLAAVLAVTLFAVTISAQDFKARAIAIHKQTPLIDGHNDYPWALRDIDPGRDLSKADIAEPVPKLMTDIPRLR